MGETNRIEELEARIRELELELERRQEIIKILFDHNPDGVIIGDASGRLEMNDAARETFGLDSGTLAPESWNDGHGMFHEDTVTPFRMEEIPMVRTLTRGERVDDVVIFVRNEHRPEGLFLTLSSRPLPGDGALAIQRDITERRKMEAEIARRNAELAAREEENRELIARLRVAVDELSTPVLEIWDDVLALPVVGVVDTQRSAQMTERLLAELVRTRAEHVILDLTGVELIDTSTADRFLKLARAVQLLGARCIVTGIQPAVSQTLVELGVDFTALETHHNLKNALEACIRRRTVGGKAVATR